MTTLTDAVLHDRAQRLRERHAAALLAVDARQPEPCHDAGQVAAEIVALAVAGDRAGLRALGLDCPGAGPVSDAEVAAALAPRAPTKQTAEPRRAGPARKE
jgi:hypothetical protein